MEQNSPPKYLEMLAPLMLMAFGLVATAQMWGDFQLYGHSANLDYFRQLSFDKCIKAGILYPRWLPDTYHGYGSPLFHFYGPLPYYITEVFILVGSSVASAIKASMIFTLLLSGFGMYLLCRDFVGPLSSFIAGLAYMLAPYHMVDMVVRHAMGEHMAFAFVPFAVWGLTGMIQGRRYLRFTVGAFSLAALILTHNVSAMLAMGALLLWLAVLGLRIKDRFKILWGAAQLSCGLCLAAFFWVPVMAEKHLTYAMESLTAGYFVYWDHFVYPIQLILPFWGYGGSRAGIENDTMSYQIGIPHLIFFFVAIVFFIRGFDKDRHSSTLVKYGLVLFAGSVFMCLPYSSFVYKMIPLLPYVQFPWRFLLFVAFAASILAVALEPVAAGIKKPWVLPLFIAIAGTMVVAFYAGYTKPKAYYYWKQDGKFHSWSLSRIDKIKDSSQYLSVWEIGGLDYWREKGETGTSRDDYLPRVCKRPPESEYSYVPTRVPDDFVWWNGAGKAEVNWRGDGPVDLVADVHTEQSGLVEFARFLFPGWRAYVNGKEAKIKPHKNRGTIMVALDPGQSRVELRFGSTPLRYATGFFSLIVLLVLILVFIRGMVREKTLSDG